MARIDAPACIVDADAAVVKEAVGARDQFAVEVFDEDVGAKGEVIYRCRGERNEASSEKRENGAELAEGAFLKTLSSFAGTHQR